jgi:hypothetical protein
MASVIDYAAVLRGAVVIASIGDLSGMPERELARLLPSPGGHAEQKLSAGRLFSFTSTPGLAYVAVSPQSAERQRPLLFLDALSRRWAAAFGAQSLAASGHALDGLMVAHFSALFTEYGSAGRAAGLAAELDQAAQFLTDAMAKGLDRSADLELISTKSEALLTTSREFRAHAAQLRWRMWCQCARSWAVWAVVVALVAYFVLSRLCGGWALAGCF